MIYVTAQSPFSGKEPHSRVTGSLADLRQFVPFLVCMLRLAVKPVTLSEVPDNFNLKTSDSSISLGFYFSLT